MFTLRPLLTGEGRDAHGRILGEAARLAEEGKLVPRLYGRRFTLDEADEAHEMVNSGRARGKMSLEVGGA